jgi:glycosyltransferase involved in cell wall biosynthesis
MKICFICGEYPPGHHGGIGTMTQVLGRSLSRQGHDVRVIGVYPPNHESPEFEVDQGVRVWRLRDSIYKGGWIAARIWLYRKVADWVRAGHVEVVEVPDYHGWAAGWKKFGAPVIVRLHGSLTYFASELHQPVDRMGYWLERSSLRRADYVCSVSEYTSKLTAQLFNIALDFAPVLYNPVELIADSPGVPRAQNRVVFSGTLTGKKGVVSLIKAWTTVVKSRPDAELHIFGKDARAANGQSMQAVLSSLLNGARASVHFHGHVSRQKLLDVFQTSGVAVFPSQAEAFAIAPLEAMASGCPTIYSQRGSGPELMEHSRQGLLVDPDKPEQIAEAILRVQSDISFARALGEAGRARVVERFSIDKLTAQNIAFYNRCVKDFHSRQQRPS